MLAKTAAGVRYAKRLCDRCSLYPCWNAGNWVLRSAKVLTWWPKANPCLEVRFKRSRMPRPPT